MTFYEEYLEIDAPERFRWTFLFGHPGRRAAGQAGGRTFEDLSGRTHVRSVGEMGSVSEIEAAVAVGMIEGGLQLWDRLADLLAEG